MTMNSITVLQWLHSYRRRRGPLDGQTVSTAACRTADDCCSKSIIQNQFFRVGLTVNYIQPDCARSPCCLNSHVTTPQITHSAQNTSCTLPPGSVFYHLFTWPLYRSRPMSDRPPNAFCIVWCLVVITRLFSYWPVYQARASTTARDRRLDIGPIWKQSCDNLFIIRSNLIIRQRINYFICHNSLLEYAENNWWMTDRLLRRLYSASASCKTDQRRPSLSMTYGNSELSYAFYRSARTDISPGNFHL